MWHFPISRPAQWSLLISDAPPPDRWTWDYNLGPPHIKSWSRPTEYSPLPRPYGLEGVVLRTLVSTQISQGSGPGVSGLSLIRNEILTFCDPQDNLHPEDQECDDRHMQRFSCIVILFRGLTKYSSDKSLCYSIVGSTRASKPHPARVVTFASNFAPTMIMNPPPGDFSTPSTLIMSLRELLKVWTLQVPRWSPAWK